jgi:AcrR family transcriptional regulator
MGKVPHKRSAASGKETRKALIEKAETLIAELGVEGISIRQVGAAIGSSNPSVVTYHFGNKDALIEAIYRYRLPGLEARRGELLRKAEEAGATEDIGTLFRIFWLPLHELVNGDGIHSYARFLASVLRSGLTETRGFVSADFPISSEIVDRLTALLPAEIARQMPQRGPIVGLIILNSLMLMDRDLPVDPHERGVTFENALSMATAALLAPVSANG